MMALVWGLGEVVLFAVVWFFYFRKKMFDRDPAKKNFFRRICFFAAVMLLIAIVFGFFANRNGINPAVCIRLLLTYLGISAAFFTDITEERIPNCIVIIMLISGLICLIADWSTKDLSVFFLVMKYGLGLLVPLISLYIVSRLTNGGLGFGDVKLISAAGFLTGLTTAFGILFYALVFCALIAIVLLAAKRKTVHEAVPFGPCLYVGYILTLFISYV